MDRFVKQYGVDRRWRHFSLESDIASTCTEVFELHGAIKHQRSMHPFANVTSVEKNIGTLLLDHVGEIKIMNEFSADCIRSIF